MTEADLEDALAAPDSVAIVDGRRVRLTTLDRVLWPATGWRKRDMLRYVVRASGALLAHVRGRPVTLARFPEGVDGPAWYQANCRGRPEWLRVERIEGRGGRVFEYCLVDNLAGLLWVANLGTVELHPFAWTVEHPRQPTALLLDLDPGRPAGIRECATVARYARDALDALDLAAWVKTSGALGLHVVAPLAPGQSFADAKAVARRLAVALQATHPELVTARMARSERPGKVFVDWVQNVPTRSTIAAWSLRAMPVPTVSAPVTWDEVGRAADGRDALVIGPDEALRRLDTLGDLFAPTLAGGGRLPAVEPAAVR